MKTAQWINSVGYFSCALDPARLLSSIGIRADPWQRQVLQSRQRHLLLNCSRQSGKSTAVAALALHTALFTAGSLTLIISKSQRQSIELFRKVKDIYNALGRPFASSIENLTNLELANGSRVVALPGKEATVRSYSKVDLILIDEASRVPDDLYYAVRPMLAVSRGRLVALSTPFGARGFFWKEWEESKAAQRIVVTWHDCPRITPEFIAGELATMGQTWIDQEYLCLFTTMHGLVYPDFTGTHEICWFPAAKLVGGIDWGFRAPFVALWGYLDDLDVLHIQDERYLRETPLHEHSAALSKRIEWWADPAGATEIAEFRYQGHRIRRPYNSIRLGITAVSARIRTGRLKVNKFRCPNLCAEAQLYRYEDEREEPLDEHNHAMDALRYMICGIDKKFICKLRRWSGKFAAADAEAARAVPVYPKPHDSLFYDETHWVPFA